MDPPPDGRVPTPVAKATELTFRSLSALRRKRIVHPAGVAFEATLTATAAEPTGSSLLDSEAPRTALVRLSRSLGLPERLADPCGLGIRVPDAYGPGRHQDILLVTSGSRAVARHLILPARGFAARSYSSLLPYRLAGRLKLFGAICELDGDGPRLADLTAVSESDLVFSLRLANPRGAWQTVGRLELGKQFPDAEAEHLRLDPACHFGGGLEPVGLLNRLRLPAYRGSQRGRGARTARR
jgi:hypothetical protein